MTTRNYSIGSVGGRAKLGEIGRPMASSFNYPSPQHSFEYSHVVAEIRSEGSKDVAEVVETETRSKEKEHARKSSSKAPLISISAIVGDLASDSAIAVQEEERKEEDCGKGVAAREGEIEIEKRRGGEVEASDKGEAVIVAEENLAVSTRIEESTETEESLEEAQVVPVWEPDTRQDDQIAPVTQPAPQQKRDNNVNEVCPWEDE